MVKEVRKMQGGLSSLVGLTEEKERARIDIKACLITGEPYPHTLLHGVGGCGKTLLARCIGEELGYHFVEREGAALKTRNHIVELLSLSHAAAHECNKHLLLFIDECHRLPVVLQEVFYYPMKEWRITTVGGEICFSPFTLMAATTRKDMLDEASFVDRFQNKWEIKRFDELHIQEILVHLFEEEGVLFDVRVIRLIAQRCLGIPRQASNLAMKIRNLVLWRGGDWVVTMQDIYKVFELEGIDEIGLSELHVNYLLELMKSKGEPKGLRALAGKLSQNEDVLVGSVEPVLLSLDMIDLHSRGRVLTETGYRHLAKSGLV